ncbi:hypothetical protein [Hymenobacter metallicola]|uniref:Uncharacterized protein n=1 Tax=Hymenobacter metallicola TaxID=2563114 RepID=A0A4Z0QJ65_9BACT|nr:hypothetical protein [Hymenobacter metallicola]TGE29824.1 hypothetical protein E5K02_10295 [Hymenobacter metallicola]
MAEKSTLRFPIDKLKAGQRVLDAHPELRAYPAFVEHGAGENDCWLRFTIFYADKGSEYRDLPVDHKKRECMRRAGVPATDKRRAAVEKWEDKDVAAMINQYVRLQSSLSYALWFHGLESAWQTIEGLSAPIERGSLDETKIQTAQKTRKDNLDAMFEQVPKLESLGNTLFLNDEELKEVQQRDVLNQTGSVEKRAVGQSFVPKRK